MSNYLTIHLKKHEVAFGNYLSPLTKYLATLDKNIQVYVKPQTEFITYYAYYNSIDPSNYQTETKWYDPNEIGFQHPTDFQNIHVDGRHHHLLYCFIKENNIKAIYITDQDLTDELGENNLLKEIESYNGVYTYSYVYNLSALPEDFITDCEARKLN